MTKCRSFPLVCGEKGKKGGKEESSPGEKERSHRGRKRAVTGRGQFVQVYKSTYIERGKRSKNPSKDFWKWNGSLRRRRGEGGGEHTKTKQMVEQKRQGNHKLAFPSPFLLLSAHQSGQTDGKLLPEEEVGEKRKRRRGLHGKAAIAASFSLTRVG